MNARFRFAPRALVILLATTACGGGGSFGEAELIGAIGAFDFSNDVSVYHNTGLRGETQFTHIVVVDRKVDCIDMAWTTNNYFFEPPEVDFPFAAVQFSWSAEIEATTYSLDAGDGAVDGWRILAEDIPANASKEVDAETAEQGTVNITAIGDGSITGNFDAVYGDGNVSGTFVTTECRNVR